MLDYSAITPLLSDDSPLDAKARAVLEKAVEVRRRTETGAVSNWVRPDTKFDSPAGQMLQKTTWDEMQGQPQAIVETLEKEGKAIGEIAAALAKRPLERIYVVGCGDSWYSALGVRSFYEELLGVPCEALQSLDFAYYYYKMANERSLMLALSSTGGTARTVEAMLMAQARGAAAVAVTNTPLSLMTQAADHTLMIHARRGGWPTQASTATMAALDQLAIEIARQRGGSSSALDKLEKALHGTPEQVAAVLKNENDKAQDAAVRAWERQVYLFAGGGPAYACAMFGAAKIKEMTPSLAYALPQEEVHHFDSLKPGNPVFVIAPKGWSVPRATNTAERGKRNGGQVYGVVTAGGSPLLPHLDLAFELPAMEESLVPIVYTAPVQMFAYHSGITKLRQAGADRKD